MSCDCGQVSVRSATERRVTSVALALNVLMCGVGLAAAYYSQSTGILADAIDMGADASAYALALVAIGHTVRARTIAARWTGGVLMALGVGVIAEAVRRWFTGSDPFGPMMVGYSILSFCVNLYVLASLSKIRDGGAHLNASYICTRVDVLANMVVFIAGGIVWFAGARWVDLAAGTAIAILIFSEAREIFNGAKEQEVEA